MKILLISSTALKTPPDNYGGLERVWWDYSIGLSELGHDVTLIGAKGSSSTGAKVIETVKPWNMLSPDEQKAYGKADKVWNGWRAHEEEAFNMYKDMLPEFDVVGDASWAKWSYLGKKEAIIGTCHSIKSYNSKPPQSYPLFTGVSRGHARFISRDLHIPCRVLWNPVNIEEMPFQKEKGERILSLNRIMPQKGIHHFLTLADQSKIKADVAGDDSQLVSDQMYVQWMKQRCAQSAYVQYHGLVTDAQRIDLLKNAKCLLAFKDMGYEEVFGLSLVEALACGTPVIAVHSWGPDDIIQDGKNGFLCNTMEEVGKAIAKVSEIKSEDCRESVKRFSRKERSMAYAKMMERVKDGSRW